LAPTLLSIPGIGRLSALALIADMPELGRASEKEIAHCSASPR
jgi:hypothetical protein